MWALNTPERNPFSPQKRLLQLFQLLQPMFQLYLTFLVVHHINLVKRFQQTNQKVWTLLGYQYHTMQDTCVIGCYLLRNLIKAKKIRERLEANTCKLGHLWTRTCRFTKKPEWLKELNPTAAVSQAEATEGFLATLRPRSAIPGPTNPIDWR